jgi:hypothetical protein
LNVGDLGIEKIEKVETSVPKVCWELCDYCEDWVMQNEIGRHKHICQGVEQFSNSI